MPDAWKALDVRTLKEEEGSRAFGLGKSSFGNVSMLVVWFNFSCLEWGAEGVEGE